VRDDSAFGPQTDMRRMLSAALRTHVPKIALIDKMLRHGCDNLSMIRHSLFIWQKAGKV
jgi:hypothetical protein